MKSSTDRRRGSKQQWVKEMIWTDTKLFKVFFNSGGSALTPSMNLFFTLASEETNILNFESQTKYIKLITTKACLVFLKITY